MIQKKINSKSLSWPKDFELRSLSTNSEVDKIVKIMKDEFSKRPEHYWIGAHPSMLRKVRKRLKNLIKNPDKNVNFWLIYKEKKLLGFFPYRLTKN